MSIVPSTIPTSSLTLADVLTIARDFAPARVRMQPLPGSATEQDVLRIAQSEQRLCELVDGTLVEKLMGAYESLLAAWLIQLLGPHIRSHNLGVLLGADGMLALAPGLVRIPDVSFIAWSQIPSRKFPRQPIPSLHPDLAIEVISPANSKREMDRKLRDYFHAGTRMVWMIDPALQQVDVFHSLDAKTSYNTGDMLSGGEVLPGFSLAVAEIFAIPTDEA